MPRLAPLPLSPELSDLAQLFGKSHGFLNRWNDTLATPLEEEPIEIGEKYLAAHGWHVGRHRG